jgi:hypothetical protein
VHSECTLPNGSLHSVGTLRDREPQECTECIAPLGGVHRAVHSAAGRLRRFKGEGGRNLYNLSIPITCACPSFLSAGSGEFVRNHVR